MDKGACTPFKAYTLKVVIFLPSVFEKTRKEREREVQPLTLLMARGNKEDIMNYILQQKMRVQEKKL